MRNERGQEHATKGRSPRIYCTGRRHGSRCKSMFAGIKTERRKVLAIDTRHPIENVYKVQQQTKSENIKEMIDGIDVGGEI